MANSDITLIYYTANIIPPVPAQRMRDHLQKTALAYSLPIVSVSQEPLDLGVNVYVGRIGVSIWNLYFQVLVGVRLAETPFVAMCEDDCLYSPSHFKCFRPETDFAFNMNRWSLRVWEDAEEFSHKERVVFSQMIAQTNSLREALEERLALKKKELTEAQEAHLKLYLGEPGRYEKQLGLTLRTVERFRSPEPNVVFDHLYGMQAQHLARRKKLGPDRTWVLEPWGHASEVKKKYWGDIDTGREKKAL